MRIKRGNSQLNNYKKRHLLRMSSSYDTKEGHVFCMLKAFDSTEGLLHITELHSGREGGQCSLNLSVLLEPVKANCVFHAHVY